MRLLETYREQSRGFQMALSAVTSNWQGCNWTEMVGFEPTDGASRRADWESGALSRSATSPNESAQPTIRILRCVSWAFAFLSTLRQYNNILIPSSSEYACPV